jgi:hypothetical protein
MCHARQVTQDERGGPLRANNAGARARTISWLYVAFILQHHSRGTAAMRSCHFMKKLSFLLLLAALAFSCKKSEETADPQTGHFNINGIHDVDLSESATGVMSIPLSIVPTGGNDTVALFADDLPQGLYVSFTPREGVTTFQSVMKLAYDFSGAGGTYTIKVRGKGHSGERSYEMKVTLAAYNGWQLGQDVYKRLVVVKQTSGAYQAILITATNGAVLRLSFPKGVPLPQTSAVYPIIRDTAQKGMQITLYDGAQIWSATGQSTNGGEAASGRFVIDSLKRFVFKCSDVEMSDGLRKKNLNCSIGE